MMFDATHIVGAGLVAIGVLFAVIWVIYPPHTAEYMRRGTDRILGITQEKYDDPCPACMVPLNQHTNAEYQHCAKEFFR